MLPSSLKHSVVWQTKNELHLQYKVVDTIQTSKPSKLSWQLLKFFPICSKNVDKQNELHSE